MLPEDCYHVLISVITSLIVLGSPKNRGLPMWLGGKNPLADAGDEGSISGSGRSPREGNGNPLQYSCLGNPTTEDPGRLQSMGHKELDMTLRPTRSQEGRAGTIWFAHHRS